MMKDWSPGSYKALDRAEVMEGLSVSPLFRCTHCNHHLSLCNLNQDANSKAALSQLRSWSHALEGQDGTPCLANLPILLYKATDMSSQREIRELAFNTMDLKAGQDKVLFSVCCSFQFTQKYWRFTEGLLRQLPKTETHACEVCDNSCHSSMPQDSCLWNRGIIVTVSDSGERRSKPWMLRASLTYWRHSVLAFSHHLCAFIILLSFGFPLFIKQPVLPDPLIAMMVLDVLEKGL